MEFCHKRSIISSFKKISDALRL